jgi:transketolase
MGGFGSAVAEVLVDEYPVPMRRIGVQDRWVDSGGVDELFTHYGMQPADIAAAARVVIAARKEGVQV